MKRAKYECGYSKKALALLVAVMIVIGCTVGGTLAWLMDTTDPVTNTFTAGSIAISLTESENLDLKMVPGDTIKKDPKVTVAANSEACWLFVKVEENDSVDTYLEYAIDSAWTKLEDGVYYIQQEATSNNTVEHVVIKDNNVTVRDTCKKADMDAVRDGTTAAPVLTFTAYAVQQEGFDTVEKAWTEAKTLDPANP